MQQVIKTSKVNEFSYKKSIINISKLIAFIEKVN